MFGTRIRAVVPALLLLMSSQCFGQNYFLKLVTFEDPPYVFEHDSHTAVTNRGLASKIVDAILKASSIDYQLELLPPKRAILTASQTSDTCVFPIERNQEREVQFSWIGPLLISRTGLYALEARPIQSRITSLIDAKAYRIGSHLGSAMGEYLKELEFKVDLAALSTANIQKLQFNRIDLWETEELIAAYTSHKSGIKLRPSELDFFTSLRALACHPSVPEPLIDKIREELYKMYRSGEIKEIQTKLEQSLRSLSNQN